MAAEKAAEHALALDPSNAKAKFRLSRALDGRGAHARALEIIERVRHWPAARPTPPNQTRTRPTKRYSPAALLMYLIMAWHH